MPIQPSVCIDSVFEGVPLDVAVRQVAKLEYPAIEFWCWWEKDIDQVDQLCSELKLSIAATCTKFISLVDPRVRSSYLAGLEESIAAARRLGCPTLISQVGDFREGVTRDEQFGSLVDGLREAAKLLAGTGVTLAIEPLNELVDHQGYFLIRSDEAFRCIEEVASDNIKVTFDIYHQQISEGNVIHNATTHINKIAHFHAAGNPGRNELDRGELNYAEIVKALNATSYDGYVGLEYWPLNAAPDDLTEAISGLGRARELFS
ncbi:MAG TPA: glyoxylate-induced protein [Planctomycetaceae bacterium]|nr:glyoxylate-induced protein [Planctomycetaceae bacterium]